MVGPDELLGLAIEARQAAYAPYSRFHVGAAVIGGSGRIYKGCNVESASYSLTCCAERVAVFKAISEGETTILGVAVVTDTQPAAGPCGACRQVLYEFGPDAWVVCGSTDGTSWRTTMKELLPQGFDGSALRGR
jgi:cytidine deaminase